MEPEPNMPPPCQTCPCHANHPVAGRSVVRWLPVVLWRACAPVSFPAGQRIDETEVETVVDCARAFLLHRPVRADRVMVGWCVNDYQIDIATPAGRTEYKRIIDQATAVGARHLLFSRAF
jgi:hypothetical protein